MFYDIKNYIKSCVACAKRKAYGATTAPLKPLEQSNFFWQRVAMDVVGPLPETYQGNRYILVMSEYATRYMIAVAMQNQKARTIAKAFILNVILRYGCPLEILTDRGTNFLSHLIKEICSLLNIKQTRTTAYHPATDGNVERFNRTMGDMLSTALTNDVNTWDEYLPYVIFLYNTSVHASTNETPHYLLFGQDPIEPDDISSVTARKRCIDNECDEYFRLWRESIEIARENFRKAQTSQKKWYDRGTKQVTYKIGDTILLRDMKLRSKLAPRWEGPYVVTRKLGQLNYAVIKSQTSSTELIVNVNRMKLLPIRDTDPTQNASFTSEKMDNSHSTDWKIELPEEFSFEEVIPDLPESPYIKEDSNLFPELAENSVTPEIETHDPLFQPELDDVDIDSNKENIDPNKDRSTKTKYNLRSKIKRPVRYAEEF
jgi:IS30 family transposase